MSRLRRTSQSREDLPADALASTPAHSASATAKPASQTNEGAIVASLPTLTKIFDLQYEGQVNPDGTSRQDELLRCDPGETVELLREPENNIDPNCINVISRRGVQIGTLGRAAMLAPALDQGRPHRAKLHCLTGGLPDYPFYGARISIVWDDRLEHPHRPLDRHQRAERQRRLMSSMSLPERARHVLARLFRGVPRPAS